MRDDKKSIDGVITNSKLRSGRKIGLTDDQLLKQKRAEVAIAHMAQKTNAKHDLLESKGKNVQEEEMGSFVEPEDLKRLEEKEKSKKPIKLPKKGQKKLFKAISKGKIDPNNPAEIRNFAQKYRRKSRIKRAIGCIILLGLIVLGYFGVKFWNQINNALDGVFAGGTIFDFVKKDPLKKDLYGRTNVIVFGTEGYDSTGSSHDGYLLTDTMMVLSFSEEQGDVFMVSLPRDLEVKHDCANYLGTYYGKLNETFVCGLANAGNNPYVDAITPEQDAAASDALRATASEILGLDIQYSVHVNFTVLIDVVDALGGIDVLIESSDPNVDSIMDRNFDWECNYRCYYVNWPVGQVAHLDGKHALALARARGASGGWGLPRSNFDREVNQQKIIVALMEKAKQTNFMANPQGTLDLLEALGANISTTFKISEVRTLIDVAQKVAGEDGDIASKAKSIPLLNSERPGYSVVDGTGQPIAGQFRYAGIHNLINEAITGQLDWWDPVVEEPENGALTE